MGCFNIFAIVRKEQKIKKGRKPGWNRTLRFNIQAGNNVWEIGRPGAADFCCRSKGSERLDIYNERAWRGRFLLSLKAAFVLGIYWKFGNQPNF